MASLKRLRRKGRKLRSEARFAVLGLLRRVSHRADDSWEAERKVRHMDDLRRLRAFLAERPALRLAITSAGRVDGAGGQALAVISAMAFAHNHHCRYLHTPFRHVDHVEGDAAEWTRRWETFFGFGHGEERVPPGARIVPIDRFLRRIGRDPKSASDPRIVVRGLSFRYAEMAEPDTLRHLMPVLRAKYHAADKSAIPLFGTPGVVNVAVHVRRGDVGPQDARYMADAPILATIAQVRAAIGSTGRAAIINLFSEGTADRFQACSAAGCALHLSTDPFETFHNLVAADLLVTTDSAFGRVAAMLSDGIALNPTGKWGMADTWLRRVPDGSFDGARLAALLGAGFADRQKAERAPAGSL